MRKLYIGLLLLLATSVHAASIQQWHMKIAKSRSSSGSYTWSYIAGCEGKDDTNDTDVACSASLNVAAGDLLVAVVKWDGTDPGSNSVAATSGEANTMTLTSVSTTPANHSSMVMGYKTAAAANGTATFQATLGDSRTYKYIAVMQFRPSGGTTSLSDGPSATTYDGSDPVSSGTITPTGNALVVVGGCGNYTTNLSNQVVDGEAADDILEEDGGYGSIWHKIYASGNASVNVTITQSASDRMVVNILAFKTE